MDVNSTCRARPHQTSCKQLPISDTPCPTQSVGHPFANPMLNLHESWHSVIRCWAVGVLPLPIRHQPEGRAEKSHPPVRVSIYDRQPVTRFPFHAISATRRGINNVETLAREATTTRSRTWCFGSRTRDTKHQEGRECNSR